MHSPDTLDGGRAVPADHDTPAVLLTDWPAIDVAGVDVVGGKAATLARLAGLEFPVPAGFAVPVAVYRAWLGDGVADCLQTAARLDADQGEALNALHGDLLRRRPPTGLVNALESLLDTPSWRGRACAVRSSAPQEDAAQASFAGIHRTVLNVTGADSLARAIVQVWASLWTPAAVAYRQRIGLPHEQAAMAVLVMPLVRAEAAGIAFSCDPASGRDDRLVVHANHGLGESLVDGEVAGDEAVLEVSRVDETLSLVGYRIGAKRRRSVPRADGGTELLNASAEHAAARVLDDAQALRLGRLLRLAATALGDVGQPFDMEWAWDGERFWLLQARPVTAIARCTYPALLALPDIWSRGNTVDVVPHPLSPVEWATVLGTCNTMLESGWRLVGYPLHPGIQRVRIIDGRMYLNMSVIQWECFDGFGLLPLATNRLVGGHQPEIPVTAASRAARRQHFWRKVRFAIHAEGLRRRGRRQVAALSKLWHAWRDKPLPTGDAARIDLVNELMRAVRHSDGMLFMQGSGGGALSTLVDMLDSRSPGEGHALAAALLAGGQPSVSAQQGYDLARVAQMAQRDATARAWLARPAAERGDWHALPSDNPFRRAFAAFLDRYGHRGIYETYLRNPRWSERPDDLLDNLPGLAQADLAALADRQRAAAAAAWQRVKTHWPWWQRGWLRVVVHAARRDSNDREAARSGFVGGAEPLRRLLLDIGSAWTRRAWLEEPSDIFQLMLHETVAVLDGSRPGAAARTLAARRKADFQRWRQIVPREVVLEGDAALLQAPPAEIDDGVPAAGAHPVLRGVAVGSGRATGPVRRVRTPADGAMLQPGDVLLAPSTDPAWTPLFLRAAALVVETGGFMSHGAIVARELGIPAVVNLPGALALLRDGERVQVDGGSGTVTRLDLRA